MKKRNVFVILSGLWLLMAFEIQATEPRTKQLYESRAVNGLLTVTVNGKTYEAIHEVVRCFSNPAATRVILVIAKEGRYQLLADQAYPPVEAGYFLESLQISQDGKQFACLWENNKSQKLVMINGNTYGPFEDVLQLQVSDQGEQWLLGARLAENQYQVWVSGKLYGPFTDVPFLCLAPDASFWCFAAINQQGETSLTTNTKVWDSIEYANMDSLDFTKSVWSYRVTVRESAEVTVVNGQVYEDYLYSGPLLVTKRSAHWGFSAMKATENGEIPVVMIDGREFDGEDLELVDQPPMESFVWKVQANDQCQLKILDIK